MELSPVFNPSAHLFGNQSELQDSSGYFKFKAMFLYT